MNAAAWLVRLCAGTTSGVAFAAAAILANEVDDLPDDLHRIAVDGLATFLRQWTAHQLVPACVAAAPLLLALTLGARHVAGFARRPALFFTVLAIVGTASIGLSWQVSVWLGQLPPFTSAQMDWPRLFDGWASTMLWGALFGWLYVLSARRRDDALRLSLQHRRRALLGRQLAQSRLVAARAQIDPRLVVRTLRAAQARHAGARDAASPGGMDAAALIDLLVTHLRGALHRVRDARPLLVADLALVRSHAALRAAETGVVIDVDIAPLQAADPARGAGPAFLVVRAMIDAAAGAAPARVHVRLAAVSTGLRAEVSLDGASLPATQRDALAASLAEHGTGLDTLRHPDSSGGSTHVAHVPLD